MGSEHQELRSQLLQRIEKIDDEALLRQVKALLDLHEEGRWADLPNMVKEAVIEGYGQSERGEGTPHDEVMKWAREWRSK